MYTDFSPSLGNEKDQHENFQESIIEVPHDWEQLNAHGKRKLVIALVTNNGNNCLFSPLCLFRLIYMNSSKVPLLQPENYLGKQIFTE